MSGTSPRPVRFLSKVPAIKKSGRELDHKPQLMPRLRMLGFLPPCTIALDVGSKVMPPFHYAISSPTLHAVEALGDERGIAPAHY